MILQCSGKARGAYSALAASSVFVQIDVTGASGQGLDTESEVGHGSALPGSHSGGCQLLPKGMSQGPAHGFGSSSKSPDLSASRAPCLSQ